MQRLSRKGVGTTNAKDAVEKAGKAAKKGVDKVAEDTINKTARRRKLIDGFKSGEPYTGD